MNLTSYKTKRSFSRTPEPAGHRPAHRSRRPKSLFVVQKHAARRLHYDLRLEMDGALKSWAVPKGIPTRKGDKRLAVQVEDHPLEYADFEGTIPPGNYGAGSVMVWDTGTYAPLKDDPQSALQKGKLVFLLAGKKLKGEWALVRMGRKGGRQGQAWLLLKTAEDARPIPPRADDTSVQSGRSMKRIAEGPNGSREPTRKNSDHAMLLARTRTEL